MKRRSLEDMTAALSRLNPFMLRNEEGRLIMYADAKECYQLCLMALWSDFPLGFVDLAYFMRKHQQLSPYRIMCILGIREFCFVRIWDKKDPERIGKLRAIMKLLLVESGCRFDELAFESAVDALDSFLKKGGVADNLSKSRIRNLRKTE